MLIKLKLIIKYKCKGYCPQFDALISSMTAREQLKMYARIKVN